MDLRLGRCRVPPEWMLAEQQVPIAAIQGETRQLGLEGWHVNGQSQGTWDLCLCV